ncbi:MAG: amidohydrolase family protein [Gemmatimonadetes bacterium]|nr:amidohydrolase family protein [Gemmatimonadota bacterium]
MLHRTRWWLVAASVALGAVASPDPVRGQDPEFFVGDARLLVDVTVIDGRGGPARPESAVLMWGGKIRAIGPRSGIQLPQGTTIVDLDGAYVVPGYIDAHVYSSEAEDLAAMLASGIVAVREAAISPERFEERGRSSPGGEPSPAVFIGSPPLDHGPDAVGIVVDSQEDAVAEVERQVSAGTPFIGIAPGLPADWLVAATRAARRGDTPVWADRSGSGWLLSLRAGADVVSRLVSGDPELLPESKRAGYGAAAASSPTLAPWLTRLAPDGREVSAAVNAALSSDASVVPLLAYAAAPLACVPGSSCDPLPEADRQILRDAWPAAEALVRTFHAEGVRLLVGSDAPSSTPAGAGFHREMQLLVRAGIPALEVLSMATRNGAIALGQLHERGTLEVGKRADLLVLDGDPVADIRNARNVGLVFIGGRPWRVDESGVWRRVAFR